MATGSLVPSATDRLQALQEVYKVQANHRHCVGPQLQAGDKIWLYMAHCQLCNSSAKLELRFQGSFYISQQVTHRLDLPPHLQVHLVFHVSQLKSAMVNPCPGCQAPPVLPVQWQGHEEFMVAKILDSKWLYGRVHYLVVGKATAHRTTAGNLQRISILPPNSTPFIGITLTSPGPERGRNSSCFLWGGGWYCQDLGRSRVSPPPW